MANRIKDELIDEILDKTDIVGVISSRIQLKKAGRNFKAVCPFHTEKTPSFVVSPDKQIYHCFGCQSGGNVISFLMKFDRLTFRESVKLLADKADVKIPSAYFRSSEHEGAFDKYFSANEAAKNFYKGQLLSSGGKTALRILKDRGLADDSIRAFQLGYAPNAWDGLIRFFKTKGVDLGALERVGLVLRRENNSGYYDRFRNRIVFPIFDIRNKVVGFGARALGDVQPKYINSPDTPVYNKGRVLYGLNYSKNTIRDKDYAVIVEGYLDMVIPYQHGIRNIVATLGTALTPDQIRLLKRYTKTVVIVFDSDKAGEEASLRGLDMLISLEMNVRIATLPKGQDPDSFCRANGAQAFEKLIKSSKDIFDYKMGLLMKRFNKDGVRGRAAIATMMLPTIARIPNEILKASFLKKISDMLSIDESALKAELRKVRTDNYAYQAFRQDSLSKRKGGLKQAELLLLSVVLEEPQVISTIDEKLGIGQIQAEGIRHILGAVLEMSKRGKRVIPGNLMSHFDNDQTKNLISEAVSIIDTIQDRDKVLADCISRIKEDNMKDDLGRLREEIRMAQESRDVAKMNVFVTKYNELLKKRREK